MADNVCSNVALARAQRMWIVPEDTQGVLQFPAAEHIIQVTQDVALNQKTPTTDSKAKTNSLDVMNVFQGVAEAATANIGMYVSVVDMHTKPQGDALITAIMGRIAKPVSGELSAPMTVNADTITVASGFSGELLQRGVLAITNAASETEFVHYRKAVQDNSGTVTFSLLTRGYSGKSAIVAAAGDKVMYTNRAYVQDKCRQEVSVWVQIDNTLQACQGCRSTTAGISFAATDAVEITSTINGRRVYNAGSSDMAAEANTGATDVSVDNAKVFFVGQRVQNTTKADDNAGSGYLVKAVDESAGKITLGTGIAKDWLQDDVITWWMPDNGFIGREIENRSTILRVEDVRCKMLPGSLTIGTPVSYTGEIGDFYPGEGIDDVRQVTVDYNVLMRGNAAQSLRDGMEGREVRIDAEFGTEQGKKVAIVAQRVKLTMPDISFQAPTVSLNTQGRILGRKGEDSLQIILE